MVILGHEGELKVWRFPHREGSSLTGRSPTLAEGAAEFVTLRQSPRILSPLFTSFDAFDYLVTRISDDGITRKGLGSLLSHRVRRARSDRSEGFIVGLCNGYTTTPGEP